MRQMIKECRTQAMILHLKSITREREILSNEIRNIIQEFPRENSDEFDHESSYIAFKQYHDLRGKRLELEAEQACYFLAEERVEGDVNEETVAPTLMTDNVYSIMDVKGKSLDGFKNKYDYVQDAGTFIIRPGIKGNIDYLIDLLKKKCIDDAKLAKSSKRNQLSSLDKTTDASSTITKSTSSVAFNSAPETITSKSSTLSIDAHKTYIIDTLNNWWHKNKSKFNLSQFSSLEGEHYFTTIQNDSSGALKGDIKCCCEKWSSLTLRRGKFQLSNFYRHLQSLGDDNVCHAIKKMLNNPQLTSLLSKNNQQPFTTSDNVPQQVASPNRIPFNRTQLYLRHLLSQYQQIMLKALCNNQHH